MAETRKLAAIVAVDVVGFTRLTGADEARTLARLRALRSDLIDPTIAVHDGRVFKRTGDGVLVEFRSVVDAVQCAIEVQHAMTVRNAGVPDDRRIDFRIGIHLGDVVEESDGDLMGDGVNIAARLESVCIPGALCLSEQAFWQVKGRLDLDVTDLGPTQLKNIAVPVRAFSVQVGAPAAKPAPPGIKAPKRGIALTALAGAAALIALAAVAWRTVDADGGAPQLSGIALAAVAWLHRDTDRGAPQFAKVDHERSIVVLPLGNLSGDPAQDSLVDALTDELTTSIAGLPGTFVIGHNTALTYKGKPTDVRAIGRELGVKYALEGSVQPMATRIRVNAQLVDAETGAHLWAESFDEDRADLLQTEDAIVGRLARTLDLKLNDVQAAELARLRPKNPDAEDLAVRCVSRIFANYQDAGDPVKHPELYEACEEALRQDPGNTLALKALAVRLNNTGLIPGTEAEAARLDSLVQKALAIDPNDSRARFAKGMMDLTHGRYDQALVEFERVLASDSSNVGAYGNIGWIYMATGQEDKAIAVFNKAMLLSPRDPNLPFWLHYKALALGVLGRDAEASDLRRQALTLAPANREMLFAQAATLANLGHDDEARAVYQRYVAAGEGKPTTIADLKRQYAYVIGVPFWAAYVERVFAGLRKLGMAEQ